jgi:hypothetical protein
VQWVTPSWKLTTATWLAVTRLPFRHVVATRLLHQQLAASSLARRLSTEAAPPPHRRRTTATPMHRRRPTQQTEALTLTSPPPPLICWPMSPAALCLMHCPQPPPPPPLTTALRGGDIPAAYAQPPPPHATGRDGEFSPLYTPYIYLEGRPGLTRTSFRFALAEQHCKSALPALDEQVPSHGPRPAGAESTQVLWKETKRPWAPFYMFTYKQQK